MNGSRIAALALLLAVGARAVGAANTTLSNGGRGAGVYRTGEFTEPRYMERWGYGSTDQEHNNTVSGDTSIRMTGDGAIKYDTGSGLDAWVYFPNTKDLNLDVSKCTEFVLSVRSENTNGWGGSDPWIIFRDTSGRMVQYGGTDPATGGQRQPAFPQEERNDRNEHSHTPTRNVCSGRLMLPVRAQRRAPEEPVRR